MFGFIFTGCRYALSQNALKANSSNGPARVWAVKPAYGAYKSAAQFFQSKLFEWTDDMPTVSEHIDVMNLQNL